MESSSAEPEKGCFICPECGSHSPGTVLMVSVGPVSVGHDPWNSVLQIIRCAGCKRDIPAHLAERWDGISLEQAREEWKSVYRRRRR